MSGDDLPADGIRRAFATPILERVFADAAAVNRGLARAILARERREPGLVVSNVGGWHSQPDLLEWPEPEIGVLKRWMREAVGPLLDARDAALSAQAWAVVHRRGSWSASHVHPYNHWSGVYYVRIGPGEGGHVVFTDPRPAAAALPIPGHRFGADHPVRPRAGLLLVFPSWLAHSVTPYHGRGPRISIAFNLTVGSGAPG